MKSIEIIITTIFLFLTINLASVEGTKEICPNATDQAEVLIGGSFDTDFAGYDQGVDSRMTITIGDFNNEIVHMGFQ